MTYYIVILCLISHLLFLSYKIKNDIFYYFCFVVLILFSGFRFNVGNDYLSYTRIFDAIRLTGDTPYITDFSNWIVKSLIFIGGTNQLIFMFYSCITLLGICYFIKKTSDSKEISTFIFFTGSIFYLSTLSQIRQWAAVSMMAIAIVNIIERKYCLMIFFIVLAMLFHRTAVLILILPLMTRRYSLKAMAIFFALIIAGALTLEHIATLFSLYDRYSSYLKTNFFQNSSRNWALYSIYVITLGCVVIFSQYFSKNALLERKEVIMINWCLLSVYVLIVEKVLHISFEGYLRVNRYFEIPLIILIPWLIKKIKNKNMRLLMYFSLLLFCVFPSFLRALIFKGHTSFLIPYQYNFNLFL